MRVAICDDNKVMLDFLTRQISDSLKLHCVEHEMNKFSCGKDFVVQHEKTPFDVVFLDIRLPDIDGFEAAKCVRRTSEKTRIIFVTTESSLVYDSFDYHPFYFIPKGMPEILREKLNSVIGKLVDEINDNRTICFDLPHGEQKHINSNSIIYIASKSNYIDVVCQSEIIRLRRKLDSMIEELPKKSFARIHNRCIVNMKYLGKIDNGRCKAILFDETELDISRSYKADFVKKYRIFLRNFS